MKRHPSLQPLSREHHRALVCWRKLDQAIERPSESDIQAVVDELRSYWNSRFEPHLRQEEATLLPWLSPSLQGRMLREHHALRSMCETVARKGVIDGSTGNDALLRVFAETLREHIRWEERTVFPYLQEQLSDAELELLLGAAARSQVVSHPDQCEAPSMTSVALTIAGSDPSGGAGLQADLKTFHQHGVYGTSAVTLLTVQNTQGVSAVEFLDPKFVLAQLDAVLDDIPPRAAKTGALGNAAIIEAIAERAASFPFPLVVDPVMVSKHGSPLMDDEAVQVLATKLLPHAFLVTPNLAEAARLAAMEVKDLATMEMAAAAIARLGPRNVLVKGGQLDGNAVDVLWSAGRTQTLASQRTETRDTHGTGCVLSAAITAHLACGAETIAAVTEAKRFITAAIRSSPNLGSGYGPVNMHSRGGFP